MPLQVYLRQRLEISNKTDMCTFCDIEFEKKKLWLDEKEKEEEKEKKKKTTQQQIRNYNESTSRYFLITGTSDITKQRYVN